MPNHEMSLGAKLQQQYSYLALVNTLHPLSEAGVAPPLEAFAEFPPIQASVMRHASGLATDVRHQIYILGRSAYHKAGYTQADIRTDSAARLTGRAGFLALLTMPENHQQRVDRAEVFKCVLAALRPRHTSEDERILEEVSRPILNHDLNRNRPLFAAPDIEPPLDAGTLTIDYDGPLTTEHMVARHALRIDFSAINRIAADIQHEAEPVG